MRGRGSIMGIGVMFGLAALAVGASPGQAQQRDITVTPSPTSHGLTLYRQSWAVVVGIDQYRHPKVSRLNYAVNDARAVARALGPLGFPEQNITLLLNQQATRREIERVLSSVVRKAAGPEDRLVIFFATHGVTAPLPHGGEEGYLLPYDADPDDLPLTALAMQQLKQIGQRIPAKHILVAVDACYGGYSLVRAQAPTVVDRRYLELVGRSRVIQVLTAGKKDQPVIEEQGHGVFTRKLLDGLAGHADENRDGLITLPELGAWMHPRVAQASEYKQDIQWGSLEGEGQFVFVLPAAQAPPDRPTPPPPIAVAPSPSPPVAAIPPGGVRIETSPSGAEVYWDARPMGKTPVTLPPLDPGRHQLVLVLEGHQTAVEDVEVVAGQPLRIARKLEEQAGALEVLTKPSGAGIELDGVPIGTSPQKLPRVRVGKHRVTLSHKDYQPVEREVTIEYEQLARLEVELAPKPGRLVITSTPGQAEVWVGTRKLGLTVWAGELPPGQHQIRVTKDGYEDRLFDLLLGPNEAKSLDAQMKKWDLGEMVLIPAGEFWMGSDASDPNAPVDEKPKHRVYLDAYYIDKYEVANAQFRTFMDAKGYERQELWSPEGWRWRAQSNVTQPGYWTDTGWNEPRQPVVGVSWYEAEVFCRFAGKRLPTEAEWEKAARGTDGQRYPWGDQWDPSKANSNESKLGKTAPVGSYPAGASPYGAHDLAGNVWEWVADWYDKDYYKRSPERNPTGPSTGQKKVLRGGSWFNFPRRVWSAYRYDYPPDSRFNGIGFRCARGSP